MSLSQAECQVLLDCAIDSDDDIDFTLIDSDDEELFLRITDDSEESELNATSNYMEDVVPSYTEEEFKKHFRVDRSLFEFLSEKFEQSDVFQKLRPDKRINASSHIAIFLWFAGHEGCTFQKVSSLFNTSTSTISRILHRTTFFLAELSVEVIRWPTAEHKSETSNFFKYKTGFPNVIGAIGATHMNIDPQSCAKDENMDSRGNLSLVLQAACDHRKKFIDIFVGFPNSSHDSSIFQSSLIYQKLFEGCEDGIVLGDSTYPCMKNLITPYIDNGCLSDSQKLFNLRLSSNRAIIGRAISILKQRFPQLYLCKLRGVEKLSHFIEACCVLHNLANENDLDFTEKQAEPVFEDNGVHIQDFPEGKILRDKICKQLSKNV